MKAKNNTRFRLYEAGARELGAAFLLLMSRVETKVLSAWVDAWVRVLFSWKYDAGTDTLINEEGVPVPMREALPDPGMLDVVPEWGRNPHEALAMVASAHLAALEAFELRSASASLSSFLEKLGAPMSVLADYQEPARVHALADAFVEAVQDLDKDVGCFTDDAVAPFAGGMLRLLYDHVGTGRARLAVVRAYQLTKVQSEAGLGIPVEYVFRLGSALAAGTELPASSLAWSDQDLTRSEWISKLVIRAVGEVIDHLGTGEANDLSVLAPALRAYAIVGGYDEEDLPREVFVTLSRVIESVYSEPLGVTR